MIIIRESKIGNESIYSSTMVSNNKMIITTVKVSIAKVTDDKGKAYLFLYNSNKEVISDVFRYVNYEKADKSYNTRYMYIQALKLLFTYCELLNLDYRSLSIDEAKRYKDFLLGRNILKGNTVKFEIFTVRSGDVVNSYLSVYRSFYEYIGITNSAFHEFINKPSYFNELNSNNKKRYKLNEKVYKDRKKIPMYIKPEEFSRIIEIVRERYTLREEIIIRLMFECGMRIGEVLGLTLEDILTTPDEILVKGYDELGEICIRNRVFDKNYQLAKGCFIPKSQRDYKTNKYTTENIGFQLIEPSILLLFKLETYVNNIYKDMSTKDMENYSKFSKADKVSISNILEGDNYYIFLNKDKKPLSISGWNKVLRKIFIEAGLRLDKRTKKHNLNHRFRHGYAMFLRKYKGSNETEIMFKLRHKSPNTSAIYFRPDEDDVHKSNIEAIKSMYHVCPLLYD